MNTLSRFEIINSFKREIYLNKETIETISFALLICSLTLMHFSQLSGNYLLDVAIVNITVLISSFVAFVVSYYISVKYSIIFKIIMLILFFLLIK